MTTRQGANGRVAGSSPGKLPFEGKAVLVKVPVDDYNFIDQLAVKHNLSMNQVIRFMIKNERRRVESQEQK